MIKKEEENVVYRNGEGGYIFISHSHLDIDKVRIIRNVLENNGYEPLCFFLKCLNDDDEVEGLIKREIDSRDIFLYIESPNSLKSKWVRKEREYINGCNNKTIFTITLDENTDVKKEALKILDKTRVFISYSRRDEWAFDLIKNKLIERDLKVFDFNDLKAGQNWFDAITTSISQACQDGCFVLLLSKESLRASHLVNELNIAYKQNKDRILVVTIDDANCEDSSMAYLVNKISNRASLDTSCSDIESQLTDIVNKIKLILKNK